MVVAGNWHAINDPLSQARKWQTLQPDGTRSAEFGQTEPFPSENHRLQATNELYIVVDTFREADKAPGIHMQFITIELFLNHNAASVEENSTITSNAFEDEPFTTEESRRADPFCQFNIKPGTERGTQESILLAVDFFVVLAQIQRNDGAGVGRGEGRNSWL